MMRREGKEKGNVVGLLKIVLLIVEKILSEISGETQCFSGTTLLEHDRAEEDSEGAVARLLERLHPLPSGEKLAGIEGVNEEKGRKKRKTRRGRRFSITQWNQRQAAMSAATVDPEREPCQEESPLTPVPLKSELGRDSTMGEEESGFASPDGSDCTHHETHVSAPIASVGIFASVSAAEAKEVEVEGQQSPQVVEGERESVTTEMQALIASLCTLDDEVRRCLIERSDPTCCSVENGPEEMNGERPLPVRTECLGGEADEGKEERKTVNDVDEISFDASVQRSLEKHPDSSTLCSEEKMNVCKGEIELQIAISSAPPPAHKSGDGVTEVADGLGVKMKRGGRMEQCKVTFSSLPCHPSPFPIQDLNKSAPLMQQ
uniref:Uncharacterized protein n=1 Tax=Chromera velia CCMP2878 TaxID=1169474 RepID=A0A0G4FP26_9ALVE|eukprot:Cvel_18008.t1-p1 / transcript=Cvel_18008.t1 / gene=Cvel_18008 / organism=Chromera_velia_CCMP2878 / gene_product=hypothetical protein / transcript_product=hypothetical protein / location=Cvel_scaffold1468:40973-42094(-) / protein_length=374 / sequence_SO=supercontig / SO=protein_coding / is_pseudo=false